MFRSARLLLILSVFTLFAQPAFSAKPLNKIHEKMAENTKGYTVNFQDVSAVELVKFISKIGDLNFIYEESDLAFNVTFTSEEPTSLFNIMSAFAQILRIHGLSVLEDGNNLVLHKNEAVKKIPHIVSKETPLEEGEKPIIITRVFNIHNANPTNLEQILDPLISKTALVTVSEDTRQMIITDTTANIEQIAELLVILDTPKSSLDVSIYKSKNANAMQLTPLLTEIIMPLSEGNPVIIVPQKETNSVFLVSTPYLLEKCDQILKELDTYSSLQDRTLSADNILVYKLKYRSPESIEKALKDISNEAEAQGFLVSGMLESINTSTYIKQTNSLLFIGDANSLARLSALMETLDIPAKPHDKAENSKFYVYEPENKSVVEIVSYLKDMEKHLQESHLADPNILHTLETMRVIKDSNSIVFTGDAESIGEIKDLLKKLDLSEFHSKDEYYIYTPVHLAPETLLNSMRQVADRLDKAGLADQNLVTALKDAKYATYSHAIVFTGTKATIAKVKELMTELDHTDKKNLSDQNMLIYQVKYASHSELESSLDKFADSLPLESPIHEAIESATWMEEAHSFVFRGTKEALAKIKEILTLSDTAEYAQDVVFSYRIKHSSYEAIKSDLHAYAEQLVPDDPTAEAIKEARWVPDSQLLIFRGPKPSIKKITDLLAVADSAESSAPGLKQGYVVISLEHAPGNMVIKDLNKIAARLKDDKVQNVGLIHTLENCEWVPSTNSIFVSGPHKDIEQVQKFIEKFDAPQKSQVYAMVKLDYLNGEEVLKELKQATQKLKTDEFVNESLQQTIDSIEWVKSSNTLFVSGPEKDVKEVELMIKGIDVEAPSNRGKHTDFLVYKPKQITPEDFEKSVQKLAHDLKETHLSDPTLLNTLTTNRYNEETQSFVFTGPPATLTRVKDLLNKIDLDHYKSANAQFFVFAPSNLSDREFEKVVHNIVEEFKKTDYANHTLLATLESMRYVKTTHSFLFTSDEKTLTQLKSLLQDLDQEEAGMDRNSKFLLYRPEHMSAQDLYEAMKRVTKDLSGSSYTNEQFLQSLESMKIIESTHSLLFTGTPSTLPKVTELLAKVDLPSQGKGNTQFTIIRPQKASTQQVEDALEHITKDLQKSGLANPSLITTLKSMRYVKATDSLVFTGDTESIAKLKELVTEVEMEISEKVGIQKVGKTTFLVYKIKHASPHYIEQSLEHVAHDLEKSGNPDKKLIKTINDLRYVKESNSIIFTGTEGTLKKVQDLLIQFDTVHGVQKKRVGTEMYLMYQPQHIEGNDLINLAKDFEQNLVNSGVHEPQLFDTINNLKWMGKTGQILISGDKASTEKVKALLEKFDKDRVVGPKGDVSIETLEDVSFLIYKVQFHQGEEMQGVLDGIAEDLKRNKNKSSEGLIKAIQSMQWLKVTNSLVATGNPKALIRLKELLESIDVPLRQVFIEVLVIEAVLTGRLEFGLRWAGQGNYKNRLAFSGGSLPAAQSSQSLGFQDLVSQVNAKTPPLGTDMPIPTGGSMGVIGDLIFHKGATYLSLGDFVNAIQTDDDSTVVLNQKLITQDNLNSSLFVGENVPYNGSVVTNHGDNTVVASNLEYRDIGIKLSITPHIGDDDIVSLEIDQSITEEVDTGSSGGTVDTVYGIKTRKTRTSTKVHVPDKHFVAISGQIRNSTQRVKNAIPCLGGLPVIGAAFSDSRDTKNKANVIMFVRPVIVDTYEEYKKLTEHQEDIYREQGITEDFDRGMELIKSVDDE